MYWKDLLCDGEEVRLIVLKNTENIVSEFHYSMCLLDIAGTASFKMTYILEDNTVNKEVFRSKLSKAHRKVRGYLAKFDPYKVKAVKAEITGNKEMEKVLIVRSNFFFSDSEN